jgi:hypothetical protein
VPLNDDDDDNSTYLDSRATLFLVEDEDRRGVDRLLEVATSSVTN